jgi:hypothetical protein
MRILLEIISPGDYVGGFIGEDLEARVPVARTNGECEGFQDGFRDCDRIREDAMADPVPRPSAGDTQSCLSTVYPDHFRQCDEGAFELEASVEIQHHSALEARISNQMWFGYWTDSLGLMMTLGGPIGSEIGFWW